MIFQRKYDRMKEKQHRDMEGKDRAMLDDDLGSKLEKGDTFALIVSALITILPIAALFLGLAVAIGYFFVVH